MQANRLDAPFQESNSGNGLKQKTADIVIQQNPLLKPKN
jgi:hypothetical protein